MGQKMSRPRVTTKCDKCGKEDSRLLVDIQTWEDRPVGKDWLPTAWRVHNTQDGIGPEPDKVFVLCKECEEEFQLSVRDFKPTQKDKDVR